jgi:hypothetical protein
MKRSEIRRSKPLRATAPTKADVPLLKMKKCSSRRGGCGGWYRPFRPMQKACGPQCASSMVEHRKEFERQKAAADDRRKTRAQLEALKTVPQLKKEAQAAFNAWVRSRDAGLPCISCGAPPPDLSGLHAGRDCGHYRSTGAADHLRYSPDNAAGQCVSCNQHKAGNVVMYRLGLIARIGLARVEAIENDNTPVKWTREGLREIRDTYRRRANELEKEIAK